MDRDRLAMDLARRTLEVVAPEERVIFDNLPVKPLKDVPSRQAIQGSGFTFETFIYTYVIVQFCQSLTSSVTDHLYKHLLRRIKAWLFEDKEAEQREAKSQAREILLKHGIPEDRVDSVADAFLLALRQLATEIKSLKD